MPIEYTPAQLNFLRKRHARNKEEEVCCDCPGCDTCKGFVRNCTCDHDIDALRKARGM